MVTKLQKENLIKYFKIKKDPALAVFNSINELKDYVRNLIYKEFQKVLNEIEQEKQDNNDFIKEQLKLKKERIERIGEDLQKQVNEVIEKAKQLKDGAKGEKGDQGIRGFQGEKGLKGDRGLRGLKGLKGDKGDIPKKGVDYFTPQDIGKISNKALKQLETPLKSIREDIKKIFEELEKKKQIERLGAKTIHRGGVRFAYNETPTGDINGTNKTFTLAHAPNPATSLILKLGSGFLQAGGEDYTLSGRTITMEFAPPTGAIFIAVMYQY